MATLEIPEPIETIYDAGFDGSLSRNYLASNQSTGSDVDTAPSIAVQDDSFYERTLIVEEVLTLSHTTEESFGEFFVVTTIPYKDQRKPSAPYCLAYLIQEEGTGRTWVQLPYFRPATTIEPITNSFFIQDQHIISCRRQELTITSFTREVATYNFVVFLIRNKNERDQ